MVETRKKTCKQLEEDVSSPVWKLFRNWPNRQCGKLACGSATKAKSLIGSLASQVEALDYGAGQSRLRRLTIAPPPHQHIIGFATLPRAGAASSGRPTAQWNLRRMLLPLASCQRPLAFWCRFLSPKTNHLFHRRGLGIQKRKPKTSENVGATRAKRHPGSCRTNHAGCIMKGQEGICRSISRAIDSLVSFLVKIWG
jgi:hypothetical protein